MVALYLFLARSYTGAAIRAVAQDRGDRRQADRAVRREQDRELAVAERVVDLAAGLEDAAARVAQVLLPRAVARIAWRADDPGLHAQALAFLDQIETAPSLRPATEVFSERLDPEFMEEGRDAAAALDYVGACIEGPGIATTSPRFMGYIPGGGLFHSALGDMLAAASNKYSGFAPAAPGEEPGKLLLTGHIVWV